MLLLAMLCLAGQLLISARHIYPISFSVEFHKIVCKHLVFPGDEAGACAEPVLFWQDSVQQQT